LKAILKYPATASTLVSISPAPVDSPRLPLKSLMHRTQSVPSKILFKFKAKSASFRVADTDPPLEEVSVVGEGRFKGKKLTSLYTVRITPTGKEKDKQDGAGILYVEGNSRAIYAVTGELRTTKRWREHVVGTMKFANNCTGEFVRLNNKIVSFETLVNSRGESTTSVWE
jgi:hypothetical protein